MATQPQASPTEMAQLLALAAQFCSLLGRFASPGGQTPPTFSAARYAYLNTQWFAAVQQTARIRLVDTASKQSVMDATTATRNAVELLMKVIPGANPSIRWTAAKSAIDDAVLSLQAIQEMAG
jgi:hypothetical protein